MKRLKHRNHILLNYTSRWVLFGILISVMPSCKKFVEVDPPIDQLNSKLIFDNDNTAISAINGIYSNMQVIQGQIANSAMTLYMGVYSDEMTYYTAGSMDGFALNTISLSDQNTIEYNFWTPLYKYIYASNSCIEGLNASKKVSAPVKKTLVGEAKLIRAFCYFYLVNLFGEVPLILTTDYEENATKGREVVSVIYSQMISDLRAAKDSLATELVNAERTRPNSYSAAALLARVYLYNKDWENAAIQASEVISTGKYDLINTPVQEVFLSKSKETIWQLKPVNPARNTLEASQILPASAASQPTYLIRESLFKAFEDNDKRKAAWVGTRMFNGQTLYYPGKYRVRGGTGIPQTEFYILLRLAEQYLIRAEALANQNKLSEAITEIDIIRKRAGLPLISETNPAISQTDLLSAIYQERRIELFSEWGQRWFDLKRTGRASTVMSLLKPTWKPDAILWPVPSSEILKNPKLAPQNPGY